MPVVVASCADSDEVIPPANDGSALVPPHSDATVDNDADAGCVGDADGCETEVPPCEAGTWCEVKTGVDEQTTFSSVWGSGPNDVWAVGSVGRVIHWDGSQWTPSPIDIDQSLFAIWGSGPSDIWVVSSVSKIFHSTGFADGSARWSIAPLIVADDSPYRNVVVRTIWGTSSSDVWVAGNTVSTAPRTGTGVWRSVTADGGAGWASGSSLPSNAIWGSGPNDIWVVGQAVNPSNGIVRDGSRSAHTDGVAADGNAPAWTEYDTQSAYVLYAVWGSGPGDVWTVGARGTIRHFAAGAKRWSVVDSPTGETLRGVWGSGPDDIWAVGDEGTLLHYDGKAWAPTAPAFPSKKKPRLFSVWGSGPSDVWAVGEGIVLRFSGEDAGARGAEP